MTKRTDAGPGPLDDMPPTRHGWLANATSPRPAPMAHGPSADDLRHAACVDHIEVVGLTKPVCVAQGQDRAAVVAEARELSGVTEW